MLILPNCTRDASWRQPHGRGTHAA